MTALRDRLRAGDRMIGTVLASPGATAAELAAAAFDLVWIDLEHGALGLEAMQDAAIGAQAAGAAVAVRIPRWDWPRLPAVLDAGVDGVVVPAVESAQQAAAVCARLRYPPDGVRGFGPRRAGGYGRAAPDGEPACIVQIETPAGVTAASAIASVEGVDALVVGCSDLSFALGAPLDLESPGLVDAAASVQTAAEAAGVAFGVAGGGSPTVLASVARASVLVYSSDLRIYAQAMDEVAVSLRAALDREVDHAGA